MENKLPVELILQPII